MTNTDDKYSTNPLELLVESFSKDFPHPEWNDFDKSKLLSLPRAHFSGDDIKVIHDSLIQVLNELSFIKLVTISKLKYVYQGANMCYIEGNVIGLAIFTRSILEHIAIYAFVIKQAEKTIEKLENQNSPRKALEVLTKLK